MSDPVASPYQANPPSARRLLTSVIVAIVLAGAILLVAVLPAEYGIDPTGIGTRLGLTQMSGKGTAAKAIELTDNLGGNENIEKAVIPDVGEPLPLPNPAVHQGHAEVPKSETVTITLPAFGETEVKTALQTNQVVLYSWKTDNGKVYFDYHGHSPDWENKQAFVRYQEEKDGSSSANGSLVAPFTGEHGWYWVNLEDHPVVITLNVSGYYDKVINYGLAKE
ncbi:MAG: hypothetical protein QM808_15220 [Steroidobacteraceae bacterium]